MRYDQIIDVRLLAPLATAIGIAVTITLWFLNQRRKEITYRILWQDALTRARSSVRDRLEVNFDGKPVKDASLVIVQIINSGHLPVVPADYHSRLTICSGPGSKVIYADVAATAPGDLDDRCRDANGQRKNLIERYDGAEAQLSPVLLNQGDSVTVQMLVENLRGGVKVTGHINGVHRIAAWKASSFASTTLTNAGALSMAAAMLLADPKNIVQYGIAEGIPAILLFLFGYTLLSAGLYSKQKFVNRSKLEPIV